MTKINNKVWTLTFLIALLLIATPNAISECQSCDELNSEISSEMVGMKNPAAVYCTELGYEYKIIKTPEGERGICVIPDTGEEFDAWDFLEGKVGQKYSYCATIGCDTITATDGKNSFSSDYAVCVPKKQSDSEHFVTSSSESMSVTDLMNLGEKVYPKTSKNFQAEAFHTLNNEMVGSTAQVTSSDFSVGTTPSSFDWRDVNGENWMTSVKAQGGCGSCWAFASVAAVEAKVNIVMDDPDFDVDLSEQYLVSKYLPGFSIENGFIYNNCNGGSSYSALEYIRDYGITDETCYPYTASNSICSDRCSLWNKRLWTIDGIGGVPFNNIRNLLIEHGPFVMYMAILYDGEYFDENNIYRGYNLPVNHAVTLVGYNDENEYWIIKNSWGTSFNDDGYFKVGYGECNTTYYSPLAVIVSEGTYYNYPLPLPTPRPTSVPLPIPQVIPDPVPLPSVITIPLPIALPVFIPIPFPFSLP